MSASKQRTGPKEPSLKTIKRLFAESGNLCAFPKCSRALIVGKAVIGKVCHIKAKSPEGPRYDPSQTDDERHGYENLILLCGIHHDVIDDDEESYPVERLHQIKERHLAKAAALPDEEAEEGSLLIFSSPVVSVNQSGGVTAATVTVNNYSGVGFDHSGKVFAKPSFPAAEPRDGAARFRPNGAALGMKWDQMRILPQPQFDVTLAQGRAVWLRLIPIEPPREEFTAPELKNAAERGFVLRPLIDNDIEYVIAEDGFGVCDLVDHSQGHVTSAVAFAFFTGEVWSIDTYLLNLGDYKMIYFGEIADRLITRFRDYTRFLGNLGIKPPFRWIAGLEGIARMTLSIPVQNQTGYHAFGGPICMSNTIADGGLYDGIEDAANALGPFFDKIFKKCGSQRPPHLRDLTSARLR